MKLLRSIIVLAAAPALSQQEPADQTASLDVSTAPTLDLYFEVRARAAAGDEPAEDDPLRGVVLAAREFEAALGFNGVSILVDGNLAQCESASDLVGVLNALPETTTRPDGPGKRRVVELTPLAGALGRELEAVEEHWLTEEWPARKARLDAAIERLHAMLPADTQAAAFGDVERWIGARTKELTIPVRLVSRMPPPGGITLKTPRSTLSIVAIDAREGSLLAEVVVHEAIHAIVFATQRQRPIFFDIHDTLQRQGLKPRSSLFRDSTHALFFLIAADVIRLHVDPEHQSYGDATGLYERIEGIIAVERELWRRFSTGELPRGPFILELAAGIAALQEESADKDR